MTIPTTPTTPAGWYPDPAGTPRSRWWDGAQWTENYHDPLGAAQIGGGTLTAPEGTVTATPWYWALLGLLGANVLLQLSALLPTNLNSTIDNALSDPTSIVPTYTPYETITAVLTFVLIAAMIVSAFFDHKTLKSRGVPKPFHWAWSFFGILALAYPIYLIGRAAIVARRTGSSISPIWIPIGYCALIVVISIVAGIIGFSAGYNQVGFS